MNFVVVGLAAAFAGCTQTPKHTNVLIFGTNTKVAFDISAEGTTQTPTITLGYKRQEAVWMPLLANLNAEGNGPGTNPTTSQQTATETPRGNKDNTAKPHPADGGKPAPVLYQGTEGGTEPVATDTYSVIASFGATFGAEGNVKDGGAKSQNAIAQFIATGLAAREMARKGAEALTTKPSQEEAKARQAEATAREAEAKTEQLRVQAQTGITAAETEAAKLRDRARAVIVVTEGPKARAPDDLIAAAREAGLLRKKHEAQLKTSPADDTKRMILLQATEVGHSEEEISNLRNFVERIAP